MGLNFVIGNRDGEIIVDSKTIVDFRNSGFIDNIDDYSTALFLKLKNKLSADKDSIQSRGSFSFLQYATIFS